MERNTYNVIWVDDEISALLNEATKELLESEGIRVVATATHSEGNGGLEELLRKYTDRGITRDRVDAVITDANFNKFSDKVNERGERDVSGLSSVLTLIKKYDTIPFYLYTLRKKEMLLEKYVDGELDVFESNGRWFKKGVDLIPLINKIKADVDEYCSPEFLVRKQYNREFLAASRIPGAEDLLSKSLLAKNRDTQLVVFFNDARMVFEQICDKLQDQGYLPFLSSINKVSKYLSGYDVEPYSHIEGAQPIINKTLARATWFFVDMVNDGSHDKEELELKVKEYMRISQSSNLYFSVIHILMDLLLWYGQLITKDELKNQWVGHYLAFSKVYLAPDNKSFYAMDGRSKCLLQYKEGLKSNSIVAILHHIEKDDKSEYKYYSKQQEYDIIERDESCISKLIR